MGNSENDFCRRYEKKYGNDKPDIRFGMEFHELNNLVKVKISKSLTEAELVVGINVEVVQSTQENKSTN